MRVVVRYLVAISLCLQTSAVSISQPGRKAMPSPQPTYGQLPASEIPVVARSWEQEDAQRMRTDRQDYSRAMEDAAELSQLSRELQLDLERAGSGELPAATLKKADRIIKLAKNLKEKVRSY
jgi:hypothetical protein